MATKDEICKLANITRDELDSGSFNLTLTGDIVDCLPDSLELYGLTLNGCVSLKSLPEDIDINYLSLLDCPNITCLPENLKLDQLYLFVSSIDKLPVNSSCWKELVLINCRNIKSLPDICTGFAGELYLEGCTGLTSLPDIKVVYRNLNTSWTSIRYLPENIVVGGNLEVHCSEIVTLPSNIRVGKDICLQDCRNIKSLPDGLIVNGNLVISESNISELPNGLIVKGNLDIRSTPIKELPADIIVGGKILTDSDMIDTSRVNRKVPLNIAELIWANSGYMYLNEKLYRIIEQNDDYSVVMEPILDLYQKMTGNIDFFDGYILYVVKDKLYNYGIGSDLDEAYNNLLMIKSNLN